MNKTAKDYKVTFPFGATTPPYAPGRPHLGEDRSMPTGVPIVVNGVTIGLSGNTGYSTGPHLHIQKVHPKNGVFSPRGKGFSLKQPAKVSQVGQRADIGKYVRIKDAKGVEWSYFHLSKVNVKKGQPIKKEDDMHKGKSAKYWYEKSRHWKRRWENANKEMNKARKKTKSIKDDLWNKVKKVFGK